MTHDHPLAGRCSRCRRPALLDEDRWTHLGDPCEPDGSTPEFLPD